jgi:AGZA family xanthine/uracil permease-like MFS transporter
MGNPYINAVYIGHPGWKAMGGRIGYSAATGIMVILLAWFGVISLMSAIIPEVAISPILLYIGMLIGAQAFQESPRKHAPAIILALIPSLAAWGLNLVNGALGAAGVDVTDDLVGKMVNHGVLFHGLAVVGGGSILAAVVLASIGVFVIERQFMKAACFAVAGAILSFFGLMHGEGIGWNKGGWVSVAYLIVAGVLYGCEFAAVPAPSPAEVESESAAEGEVHGEPA